METPKEKAIELYNKFRKANGLMTANGYAKKQAIICVDEITKEVEEMISISNYWRDVKEELNKL